MSAVKKPKYTLEEYLTLDRNSDERLEYWAGEIFSMSGVSKEHARIEINLSARLDLLLDTSGCQVFPANMRIKVPSLPPYRYADLSALCGEALYEQIEGVDVLVNPALIIEILSDSTEGFDRGDKFSHYKFIPSFQEYLLVAQRRPHVTQFIKQAGNTWLQHEFNDLTDTLKLVSLGCELPLRGIYRGLVFPLNPVASNAPTD